MLQKYNNLYGKITTNSMALPNLWNISLSIFQLHKYARIASSQMSSNMTQVSKGREEETNKLSSFNSPPGYRSSTY